jgi:hypothetical protein
MGQGDIPKGYIRYEQDGKIVYYDPLLEETIEKVVIDIRRLLIRKEIYLREFLMK